MEVNDLQFLHTHKLLLILFVYIISIIVTNWLLITLIIVDRYSTRNVCIWEIRRQNRLKSKN